MNSLEKGHRMSDTKEKLSKPERVAADVKRYKTKREARKAHYRGTDRKHRDARLARRALKGCFGNEKPDAQKELALGTGGFNIKEIGE